MRISRSAALVLAASSAIACEHPTAPQARDAIEKTERNLLSGDIGKLESGLSTLVSNALMYGGGSHPFLPTDKISVVRDGQESQLDATVVERVYLPPSGSGARPIANRTVLAWTNGDDVHHDFNRVRMVVLVANDSVSNAVVPTFETAHPTSNARRYDRIGFALNMDPGDRRVWFSTAGTLTISDGAQIGSCPYTGKYGGYYTNIPDLQDSTVTVVCDVRRYPVSAAASLERGDPNNRHALDNLMPLRGQLQLPLQQIRGVRFVTQCAGEPMKDPPGCWDFLSFWRDKNQFAAELGVDLSAMRSRESDNVAIQTVVPGEGPDYRYERGGYNVPVRFTVFTPRAAVVLRHERTNYQTDSLLQRIPFLDLPQRIGSRVLMLVPARYFERSASQYSLAVVEIVFLPFKAP